MPTGRANREKWFHAAVLRYGLKDPLTYKQIGEILRCTPQWAEVLAKKGRSVARDEAERVRRNRGPSA